RARPRTISSEAFVQGLRELGYVEGQNLILEYRWSAGNVDRLRDHAAELVRLGVHVMVTGGPLATRAARDTTRTIPIVMANDSDPIEDGFVASLGLTRVAVLWNPTEVGAARQLRDTEAAARVLGLQVQPLEIRGLEDFERAFNAARKGRADGLTILRDPPTL